MNPTELSLLGQISQGRAALDCTPPLTCEWVDRLSHAGAIARLYAHRYTLTATGEALLAECREVA